MDIIRRVKKVLLAVPAIAAGLSGQACTSTLEDVQARQEAMLDTGRYANCQMDVTPHPWWTCTYIHSFYCDDTVTGERELLIRDYITDGRCLNCQSGNEYDCAAGYVDPWSDYSGGGGGTDPYAGGGECMNDWDCPLPETCDYGVCMPLGS